MNTTNLFELPMSTLKKQVSDPFEKARALAEQFGARIGILMHLAELNTETEESVLASLPYLPLKDIRRVHDALEARIVLQSSQKAFARLDEQLQNIAQEYQEKEEQAVLDFCNDILAPELEEEYV